MKRLMVAAVLLTMTMTFTLPAYAYMDTFSSGASNWYTYYIESGYCYGYRPTYNSAGGNQGGNISGDVYSGMGKLLYSFDVNASRFGDLTGKTLMVDYKIAGTVTGPSQPIVRFYLGTDTNNYFVSNDSNGWNPNTAQGSWTNQQIAVVESNFMAWPGQTGTKTFADIAKQPTSIGLVFTDVSFTHWGFTGTVGTKIFIDNFGTPAPPPAVPIPNAVWLLGSGLVGLFGLKRKIHR